MILAHVIPLVPPTRDLPPKVSNASGRGGSPSIGPRGTQPEGDRDCRSAERKRRNNSSRESKIDEQTQKGESFVQETRTGAAACGGHVAEPRLGGLRQWWGPRRPRRAWKTRAGRTLQGRAKPPQSLRGRRPRNPGEGREQEGRD